MCIKESLEQSYEDKYFELLEDYLALKQKYEQLLKDQTNYEDDLKQ